MTIPLVILKAASFCYCTIVDHMTNIEILNKMTKKKLLSCSNFFFQSWVYNKREFLQIPRQKSEAAIGGVLLRNVFLEISQNSQENTCAFFFRASFFIKLQAYSLLRNF